MQLTYIRLLVSNFRDTYLFYRDIMGFTPLFGEENDVYADFDTGGSILALFLRPLMANAIGTGYKPPVADVQDRIALILTVDNVDEAYRQMLAQGVNFVTAPQDRPEWAVRTAHFRDPDGNLLEISSEI